MPYSLPLPLPLPPSPTSSEPSSKPSPTARQRHTPAKLWAAVYLPALALEAVDLDNLGPVAMTDGDGPYALIRAVSAAATAAGIRPGMTASAAAALCSTLTLRPRDTPREAQRLNELAAWSLCFTSAVSPEPPDALLLEVGASLKLFGGARALRARLQTALRDTGHACHLAFAPTPRAALWLARGKTGAALRDTSALTSTLGALPLDVLRLPNKTAKDFRRVGVRHLREGLRLPRKGVARRFGLALLQDWDRALGHLPEPRRHWQADHRFAAGGDLPLPLYTLTRLQPFIDGLLERLVADLRHHDAGVDRLMLVFEHAASPASQVVLRLNTTTRDRAHLARVLQSRLERVTLAAPVIAVRLQSGSFQQATPQTATLAAMPTAHGADMAPLLETLRARLGRSAVTGITVVADHRPEYATRRVAPGEHQNHFGPDQPSFRAEGAKQPQSRNPAPQSATHAHDNRSMDSATARRMTKIETSRPCWLLLHPQRLDAHNGKPCYRQQPLTRLSSAERIEAGWWDHRGIGRDYFVARAGNGTRLWIYREHKHHHWYLHGYFA